MQWGSALLLLLSHVINNGAHSKQMMTMENASVAKKRQLLRLKRTIKTFEKQFEKEHGRQSTEVSYVRRSRRIEVFTYTVPHMHVHPCVCVLERGGGVGARNPLVSRIQSLALCTLCVRVCLCRLHRY